MFMKCQGLFVLFPFANQTGFVKNKNKAFMATEFFNLKKSLSEINSKWKDDKAKVYSFYFCIPGICES